MGGESPKTTLPMWLVVGFSGHRDLPDGDGKSFVVPLGQALDDLARRCPRLAGVSSAARGADTLFAEEMLRRQHPMRIILPFPPSRFERDFEDEPQAWQRSKSVIDHAIDLEVAASGESAVDPRDAETAYMDAGIRTVDRSDVMILLWDGEPAKGRGGTGDVVAYADAVGKPLIVIDAKSGAVESRRLGRIAGDEDSTPAREVSADPRRAVAQCFTAADAEAGRHAPLVREMLRWCVWLHLIASTLAGAALVFGAEGRVAIAVAVVDVVVLVAALTLLSIRKRRHEAWRRLRMAAEVYRSHLATWDIRRGATRGRELRIIEPGLRRLARTLDLYRQLDRSAQPPLDEARRNYERDRVSAQIAYFTTRQNQSSRQAKRRQLLLTMFSGIGIAAVVLSMIALVCHAGGHRIREWLELMSIAAPLGASAMGILLITDESSRRSERYQEMIEAIQNLRPMVAEARSWEALGRAASAVEDELMEEVLEWQSFVRHTEHLH